MILMRKKRFKFFSNHDKFISKLTSLHLFLATHRQSWTLFWPLPRAVFQLQLQQLQLWLPQQASHFRSLRHNFKNAISDSLLSPEIFAVFTEIFAISGFKEKSER